MRPYLIRSQRWAPTALVLLLAVAACDRGATPDDLSTEQPLGDEHRGVELYRAMCATCHGVAGDGGLGPRLNPWTRSEAALVSIIDGTMPKQDPRLCDTQCARDVAAYILGWSRGCDSSAAPARRLRLLTRREYNATVRDLLGAERGASCSTDWDCDVAQASCIAGACADDPCELRTFVYEGGASQPEVVHVAGSFNGWPQTLAAGGWPMQRHPTRNLWVAKRSLAPGTYEYKFVLNETTWTADPENATTAGPNGNSVLNVACAGGGASPDADGTSEPAKNFPAESRPAGYAFDNNAEAGLVTAVHVEQYMKAAEALAATAVSDLGGLVPCDPAEGVSVCAAAFARSFGARAFRRPLTDDEVARYADLITAQSDFSAGVSVALQVMLSSPYFLYRFELGEPQRDGSFRLTPYEVASLLSYTFWGTLPDQELFDAAASGGLSTPEGIEEEARRLLADPRARPTIEDFALQWLGIERITSASKSAVMFPGFDDAVRQAMVDETRRFVSHVIFEGTGKYEELLTAEYTFASSALADTYGMGGLGAEMAQVESPPERRAGLLGHGSVLASYAYPDQSSPVRRGLFVRRNLLCQELGAPPANAAGVPMVDAEATTRERFAQHSSDPGCKACHHYIDDVGFGFERFDAVGRYREVENGKPVDAAGNMNDVEQLGSGTDAPYATLPELAGILAASDSAKACFTKQAFRFASGRLESPDDLCALDALTAGFAKSGYDIRELLVAITQTQDFTVRK